MTVAAANDGLPTRRQAGPSRYAVSLVIPTFNEAGNVTELMAQLDRAIPSDLPTEIVFMDDSTDDTPLVLAEAARHCRLPVSVRHRTERTGGLGGAVAEGLRAATSPWLVVMDADLQHPPSLVPDLVAAGDRAGADLVIASRYTSGGNRDGLGRSYRKLASGFCTLLAKVAFWRELRGVSDPMSGFFAVRAGSLDVEVLRPLGYKILLELIVRGRLSNIAELPYRFRERFAGTSKSGLREGWRFLCHLMILRFSSARARALAFGVIGLSGFVPNLVTLWVLWKLLGMPYLPAEILANQVAIGWNFLLIDTLLFRDRRRRHWTGRFGKFLLLANADLIGRIPLLAVLVSYAGMNVMLATVITLVISFTVRFIVTDRLIYRPHARGGDSVPKKLA
jgi:dolichol-phosphate mannosyltransferase